MDVSLDDYMQKKKGGTRNKKPSLASRLGQKQSPKRKYQQQNTQFIVTGLAKGNAKKGSGPTKVFDARIKIGGNRPQDARQKITGPKSPKEVGDLRLRMKNKRLPVDARDKIKARQGAKQQQIGQQQQVVVTGLGKPIPSLISTNRGNVGNRKGVQQIGGTLTKTVVTTGQKTPANKKFNKPQNRVKLASGAIKITTRQQVDTTSAQQLPGFVKIKNDLYVPPPKPEPIVWQQPPPPPQPQPQPQYQQPQYQQPQYVEPTVHHQPMTMRYEQPQQPVVDNLVYQSVQYHQEPVQEEPVFVTRQQVSSPPAATDTVGPYRVMVTNLHPVVTQDDLVELFGSIGALKRARLLKPGVAEILYMKREDALTACKKYHMRELDGQPMQVNMTSLQVKTKPPPPSPEHQPLFSRHSSRRDDKPPLESMNEESGDRNTYQPLRLGNSDKPGPSKMDIGLVHKALFKTVQPGQPNRPVTFTVKI